MAYGELGPDAPLDRGPVLAAGDRGPAVVVPADPAQTRAAVRWAARRPAARSTCASAAFQVPGGHARGRAVRARPGRRGCADGDDVTVDRHRHDGLPRARRRRAAAPPRASASACSTCRSSSRSTRRRCSPRRARPRGIVTAEEATVTGGLGAAVAELVVAQHRPVPDADPRRARAFAPTGRRRASCSSTSGSTADGIAAAARELLGRALSVRRSSSPIDQGTSSTKALLVDARRRDRRARPRRRSARRYPRPGWVEQDAERDLDERPGRRRAPASTAATPARVVAVGAQHPARVAAAVGARDGRAAGPAAQLAGPADRAACDALLRAGHAERWSASAAACRSTRCSRRRRPRWLLDAHDPTGAARRRRAVPGHGRLLAARAGSAASTSSRSATPRARSC